MEIGMGVQGTLALAELAIERPVENRLTCALVFINILIKRYVRVRGGALKFSDPASTTLPYVCSWQPSELAGVRRVGHR